MKKWRDGFANRRSIYNRSKQEAGVLLVKRKDLPIWDLPGGRVDERELLEEAAKREVREETGYEVEIVDKVGVYVRPSFHDVQHIYTGIVTGG